MRQTITVEAATKEPKNFNNETSWGVKVGGAWMDLYVPNRPSKGQTFLVDTEDIEWKGKTYKHARLAPLQPQPAQTQAQGQSAKPATNSNRATSYTQTEESYANVARFAHTLAKELEPGPGAERARMGLVSTFLIAFGEGKLIPGEQDEWGTVTNGAQAAHERTAAHNHLEKTIWAYCERTGKGPADSIALLKETSGKENVLELSEKQAIAARLKAEAIIDANTNYLELFTKEAKNLAKKEGWDFSSKDPATVAKKRNLLLKAGVDKPFTELTNLDIKAAYEKLTDDLPY